MNNNFFGIGVKKGFRASRTLSFFEKLMLLVYMVTSLPFRSFLLTKPIIAVADVNMGVIINKGETLSIGRIFSNTLRRNRYLELLTFYFYKSLILFGLLAIINIPTAFIFGFGSMSSSFSKIIPYGIAVAVILGVVSLVLIIASELYFDPAAYVSSRGEKGFLSDIMHNSYHGVKYHVFSLLGIYVKYFFFFLAVIAPTLGIAIILFIFAALPGAIIGSLFIVIFIILGIFLLPNIYLSFQTSKCLYYQTYVPTKHSYVVRTKEEALAIDEEEEDEDEDMEEEEE